MPATFTRRTTLQALAAGVGGLMFTANEGSRAAPVKQAVGTAALAGRSIRFADLTHALTAEFNLDPARPRIALDAIVGSGFAVGMNLNRLLLIEHTGTHIDVPRHFAAEGVSLGELPLDDLIVPLAVIDIRERVAADRDASLTPEDVDRWEKTHGRLPDGCCVAIRCDWDPISEWNKRSSMPAEVSRRSPGFGTQVVDMLIAERAVKGIAVETLSIDTGSNGPAYPVHQRWLRSGRWGIEGITNLKSIPAVGALLIVGAAPVKGATGLPVRAIALF